jgi:S-formylglutathione hydrolase
MSTLIETIGEYRCFDGRQGIYRHQSTSTRTPMRFAVYLPPQASQSRVPLLWFLSGLTCTEENFTVKAGAQRIAAALGIALVAPDTSPRAADVPTDPEKSYDFGLGAGFYLDATQAPWATHYRMYSYITQELPQIVAEHFPVDLARQGITGHSMGGHGALTIALKNPRRFRSVSAFAPIVAPMQVPWGQKAFSGYLGNDRLQWEAYDACALIGAGHRVNALLVDQGEADQFLTQQLRPELLAAACRTAGIELRLRMRSGYDHSYYFIASFIEEHLRWHHERLTA